MVENIVSAFVEFLESNNIPTQLIPFLVSLFPVLEIRGGMIAARALNIDFIQAFLVCYLGNMIPIPFILLFIRKIFALMRKVKFFGKIVDKLEARTDKKKDTIVKYQEWGLLLFVAILQSVPASTPPEVPVRVWFCASAPSEPPSCQRVFRPRGAT